MSDAQDTSIPASPLSNKDSDPSSYVDELWDQQIADGLIDLDWSAQQEQSTGGSFGNLHFDPTLPSTAIHGLSTINDDTGYADMYNASIEPHMAWQSFPGVQYPSMEMMSFSPAQQQDSSTSFCSSIDGFTSQSTSPQADCSQSSASEVNEPCYARLLHQCLFETPGHTLSLKDIYAWIKCHTQKARDPKNKGWQNSVRHNLSMNAAFERVQMSKNGESKKGSLWQLTPQAMREGVISTTRYRRDPKRKTVRHGAPAPQRQISGAKGGAATRAASQFRRQQEQKERLLRVEHGRIQRQNFTSAPMQPMPLSFMPGYPQPLPSPYFINSTRTSPVMLQPPFSDLNSPTQMQLGFEDQFKALPELQPPQFNYSESMFNMHISRDTTPSLQTDSSYTDEPLSAQSQIMPQF